jgi:hypothetical protein
MQKLKSLSKNMYRIFSIKIMVAAIVIFVLFMVFVLPAASAYKEKRAGAASSPDTSFIYSADELYEMADSYGQEGRNAYIFMRFTFDLAWPLVYLFFMAAVISNLLRCFNEDSKLRYLNLVPFAGALFDYLENIFAAITVSRFPLKTIIVAELTPVWTLIKWVTLGFGFAVLFVLIIYRLYKLIAKKS